MNGDRGQISLVLADDHPFLLEGIAESLMQNPLMCRC
jgi:DNA-binding NarL/FixJ family response regulator